MIKWFMVIVCLSVSADGQLLDRTHRRVIDARSRVNTRWGEWVGVTGYATFATAQGLFHAEGQFPGVVAADFVFTADVTLGPDATEAHLQFRLSNEGRYGVAIGNNRVRVYKQVRRANPSIDDPRITNDKEMKAIADNLSLPLPLGYLEMPLPAGASHRVRIEAVGPSFVVTVNDRVVAVRNDASLGVGRFGLYVLGVKPTARAVFSRVTADAMVLAPSNFALLYNTLGYEAEGPKRALVRTVAELPPGWVKEATFEVRQIGNDRGATGKLVYAKSLGMSTWAAEFGDVKEPGHYVLTVTMRGRREPEWGRFFEETLVSAPFEIGRRLISRRMLVPLALTNPEARRAGDHDRTMYWKRKSGKFVVQDDGVILAEGDSGYGGVLERTGDGYNTGAPIAKTFNVSADVAIDRGCDAQLQFQVTNQSLFAVTLQAGSVGGCVRPGPGAVSLHTETPVAGSYRELKREVLPQPFELGRFYRIDVLVSERDGGTFADVDVDGERMMTGVAVGNADGGFAIKAWSAAARFDHVIAWPAETRFITRNDVRIPVLPRANGTQATCEEWGDVLTYQQRRLICEPIFAQRHGFFDCNNYIGEGTSHGTFLAGLMDVWTRRADMLNADEAGDLRRAVTATAGYLDELQRTAGYTGEYAHEEPSRGARHGAKGYHQVWLGLFGDAALGANGAALDPGSQLAFDACVRASRTVKWLLAEEGRAGREEPTRFPLGKDQPAIHDSLKALVYAQLTRCAIREGDRFQPPMPPEVMLSEARSAAHRWLGHMADTPGNEPRITLNAIPWLAGVDEVLRFGNDTYLRERLETLAWRLRPIDPEGFLIVPPGTIEHWNDRTTVPIVLEPLSPLPDTNPPLTWYIVSHFASSATDAAILYHYTGREDSKNRAASSLGWVLGLNPGIPSTKALNARTEGRPWTAAAFVSNLGIPSARGMEAFMTRGSIIKEWLYWWEEDKRSVHRETWFVQPKENDFVTLLNGHMIWDGEWDYWNQGELGWMSGETFLMHDGAFLKGAIAFEDAIARRWPPVVAPPF